MIPVLDRTVFPTDPTSTWKTPVNSFFVLCNPRPDPHEHCALDDHLIHTGRLFHTIHMGLDRDGKGG